MNRALTIATLLMLTVAAPARAENMTQSDILAAELLTGWQTKDGTYIAALRLTLAPGWKTYWRSPGDAGIPPSFNWSGSDNLQAVHLHWPAPSVFHTSGLQSIGYHDALVLPITVVPRDPGRPVTLQAQVDLGVCKDICMPAMVRLSADLSVQGTANATIKAALGARPDTADEAGLSDIGCVVEPIADGLRVTATLDLPDQGAGETVVFEAGTAGIWVAEAVSSRRARQLTAMTELVTSSGQPFALDRSGVIITVISDHGAVEIRGCPAP